MEEDPHRHGREDQQDEQENAHGYSLADRRHVCVDRSGDDLQTLAAVALIARNADLIVRSGSQHGRPLARPQDDWYQFLRINHCAPFRLF